jgi:hypothetical protein
MVKEVTQKDIFGFVGGYPTRFAKIPMWKLERHLKSSRDPSHTLYVVLEVSEIILQSLAPSFL